MNRLSIQVGMIILLITAGAGPTALGNATTPTENQCQSPTQDIPLGYGVNVPASEAAVNLTVSRVNESAVRFTYHDLDGETANFGPSFPTWIYELGVRVVASNGFHIKQTTTGASLIWNQSVSTPSIIVKADASQGGNFESAGAAIQPTWAFFPIPSHSHPTNVSLADDQPGVVGDQVFLLDEYSSYTRSVGCHDIKLYFPDTVTTAKEPNEIADSLESAARNLEVGWRYETVRVFAVGEPIRWGGRAFTHEIWVSANATFTLDTSKQIQYPPKLVPANVWVHEYVHTRQRWITNGSVSEEASWLTEAMASYYMIKETERQGRMLAYNETRYWMRLNQSLHFGTNQINLTKPSTYRHNDGAYTRGAFVLASLDQRIQTTTNGRRSLEDVFQQLNEQDQVTHASFRNAVIEVGGPELGPWVDRYVSGTAVPSAPETPYEVYFELIQRRPSYQAISAMIVLTALFTVVGVIKWWRKRK